MEAVHTLIDKIVLIPKTDDRGLRWVCMGRSLPCCSSPRVCLFTDQ
jgi:hypothetical protein